MAAKDVDLANDLIPIGKFRARTAKILDAMAEDGRTLVITQNGEAAAVVMSPREFEALRYRQRVVEEVARALADVDAGRTHSSSAVRKALRARRKAKS